MQHGVVFPSARLPHPAQLSRIGRRRLAMKVRLPSYLFQCYREHPKSSCPYTAVWYQWSAWIYRRLQ
jgi:hypothetical protein